MNTEEAIKQRRSIRKFKQEKLKIEDIRAIIDCGRYAATGANLQPLKYAVANDEKMVEKIYPLTKWAGYLTDWEPNENERAVCYIAILCDTEIKQVENAKTDAGAAAALMMVGAYARGIGSCELGAIKREEIKKLLMLSENLVIMDLIALGYPAQEGSTFDISDSVRYYFDELGNVHVPKRTLDEIIVK